MTMLARPLTGRDEIILLDGAHQVPSRDWAGLAHRGFHLHGWCTAAERCGWNPRHVAIRGPVGLRAIVPAYLTGRDTIYDLHDRWLGRLSRLASRATINLRPVLSVQAPLGSTSEPLGDFSSLSDGRLHEVFDLLEAVAERDGAKAVVWPFLDASSQRLLDLGHERGYAVHYAGAAARLEVCWESFEQYVETRSKNVRRTIRADLAALHSAGVRTSFESDFRSEAPLIDREYRRAFRERNGRDAPLKRGFFCCLASEPSPGVRAHLTWAGGRLVGTSLNLVAPRVMDGTLAAFGREYRGGPVYHNDLFYEPIRLAIREGISAIDLGPTALCAKVLRGAVLRRRIVMIRGTTPTRHGLLSVLGHLVAQRTERKERRALGRLWGTRCFGQRD